MNKLFYIIFGTVFILTSCFSGNEEQKENIVVTEAKVREVPDGSNVTAGYMKIKNNTKAEDIFLNASCDFSEKTQIHETYVDENEIAGMRMVENIVVPAGESFKLVPGGYHLMLMGIEEKFNEKEKVLCTLNFKNNGKIKVEALVTGF